MKGRSCDEQEVIVGAAGESMAVAAAISVAGIWVCNWLWACCECRIETISQSCVRDRVS